jgi:arylsulfatase A-like enzyme
MQKTRQANGVAIPAIVHQPGRVPARGLQETLFSIVDVAPTLLGLAGCGVPAWMQGRDYSPLLRGEPFDAPGEVLLEMVGSPRWNLDFSDWRGFVDKTTKYAFYETGFELLFDLERDPFETRNLALQEPWRCVPHRQRLLALLEASREPFFDVVIRHGAPIATDWQSVCADSPQGPYMGLNDDGTGRMA